MIPKKALFAVLDTQHIEVRKWKEDLLKQVRPTTFSNAERFTQPKFNYRLEAADMSLLDCDRFKLGDCPNKFKAHGWDGVPGRKQVFLTREQVEYLD